MAASPQVEEQDSSCQEVWVDKLDSQQGAGEYQ